jgi:KipI family sensor histidine kinase inhibitor
VTTGVVRDAGDAGLLLQLGTTIDAAINQRVRAIAEAFRQQAWTGVRDVVPTYHSVAVHFDPGVADREALRGALTTLVDTAAVTESGRRIEVPVAYGDTFGPDLDAVAQFAGMSARDVIRLHSEREYRVFMLGFTPGFPYMGSVDVAIAAPRHATPRVRVEQGSVGIAGTQTGIYPSASPGGWQIIGRTGLALFDPSREEPALFAPGDCVKFVETGGLHPPARRSHDSPPPASPTLTVITPGLFTTIQDSGRWGYQASGVPVAGAMDVAALRAANTAVGNAADAAALEITLLGPDLRVERRCTIAVSGAALSATVDGRALANETPTVCDAGSRVRFGARRAGGRAYLAVEGGIAAPLVLGSRSTCVRAALGGLDGRALRAGDRLATGDHRAGGSQAPGMSAHGHGDIPSLCSDATTLRVMRGPQDEWFDDAAFARLEASLFTVRPDSDRMGFRLQGSEPIARRSNDEMISDAAFTGAVQVPPSGHPILLMADRPTTGGYPQIAVVISADVPRAGQLVPGDTVRFAFCSLAEAQAAWRNAGGARL